MADFAPQFTLNPSSLVKYTVEWDAYLASGESVSESSFTVDPSALSIEQTSSGSDTATVWLTGGTAGHWYLVSNHVHTSSGHEYDQEFYVYVQD